MESTIEGDEASIGPEARVLYERTTALSQGREAGMRERDPPRARARAADQRPHRPLHPLLMRLAELSLDSRLYEMRVGEGKGGCASSGGGRGRER
jgi:hypothetical protein